MAERIGPDGEASTEKQQREVRDGIRGADETYPEVPVRNGRQGANAGGRQGVDGDVRADNCGRHDGGDRRESDPSGWHAADRPAEIAGDGTDSGDEPDRMRGAAVAHPRQPAVEVREWCQANRGKHGSYRQLISSERDR